MTNKFNILDIIHNDYSKFNSIVEIDKHYHNKVTDMSFYLHVIRPHLIKTLKFNNISDEPSNNISDEPSNNISDEQSNNISINTINSDSQSISSNDSNSYENNIFDDINNNYLRPNQKLAINNMISQGFKSGIHCQIMGAGKSLIMLNTIYNHFNNNNQNKIYIWCTDRIDILDKMFFVKSKTYDTNKFDFWKSKNVIDMDLFTIIENIHTKHFVLPNLNKPVIWLINNAFLKAQTNYKKINRHDIALILSDECHSISGNVNYNMLKWFKYGDNSEFIVPIIGFSATPLRDTKNSANNLTSIYSDEISNNKLNIISNYTLIDALIDNIVLPFKHIIVEPKYEKNKNKNNEYIQHIFQKYVKTNNELPYKKGVSWSRKINPTIDNHFENISKILNEPQFKIYRHHSKMKSTKEFNDFCDSNNNSLLLCVNCCKEGSDIKNLDYAIYLDGVKKRALHVSLQTAGRVMRPDQNKLKKYAYIIELLKVTDSDDDDKEKPIEYLTVKKLFNYYKTILNLSNESLICENEQLVNKFEEIYGNTHIDETNSEIIINIAPNVEPCIIKLDMKTINWSMLKDFMSKELAKETKKEIDEFTEIINKLKSLEQFSKDNDFWLEYSNLDYKKLNILDMTEFKLKYGERFVEKTWYEILDLHFEYFLFDELKTYLKKKNKLVHTIQVINNRDDDFKKLYHKIRNTNINHIPPYPNEYYRLSGWTNYNDMFKNQTDLFMI
jgi:superfamily II DNA or RNA helicase